MQRLSRMVVAGLAFALACDEKVADDAVFDYPTGSSDGSEATGADSSTTASETGASDTGTTGTTDTGTTDTGTTDTGTTDTGATDTGATTDTGMGQTCDECWSMFCSAERADCEADTECSCIMVCVEMGGSNGTCKSQCGVSGNPPLWGDYSDCLATSCSTVC